ncbi:uncharacterized protein METZ01_LOCUS228803, partial [marine metagenome]
VLSKNPHAIFRILGDEYEDLRKVVCEKNWHALFRLLKKYRKPFENLRKAILEKNFHALFRLVDNDDLGKAVNE